jgi:hypothetical protein
MADKDPTEVIASIEESYPAPRRPLALHFFPFARFVGGGAGALLKDYPPNISSFGGGLVVTDEESAASSLGEL